MSELLENKLLLLFHSLKRLGVSTVAHLALQSHHSNATPSEKVSSLTQLCEKALVSWDGFSIRQLDEHWMKTRLAFGGVQDETIRRALLWNSEPKEAVKSQAGILLQALESIQIHPLHLAHHQALEDIRSNLIEYATLSGVAPSQPSLSFFEDLINRAQDRYLLSSRLNSFASRIHGEDQSFVRFKRLSDEDKENLVTKGHASDPYCIKRALQYAQEFGRLPKNSVLLDTPTRDPIFSSMDELSHMVNMLTNEEPKNEVSPPTPPPITKDFFLKRLFGKKEATSPITKQPSL